MKNSELPGPTTAGAIEDEAVEYNWTPGGIGKWVRFAEFCFSYRNTVLGKVLCFVRQVRFRNGQSKDRIVRNDIGQFDDEIVVKKCFWRKNEVWGGKMRKLRRLDKKITTD